MDRVGVQIGRIARQRPPQSPGSTSAARERAGNGRTRRHLPSRVHRGNLRWKAELAPGSSGET